MQGSAIIIVGGTGTGKTSLAKTLLRKTPAKNRFIFDINNEYSEFTPEPLDPFEPFEKFIEKAVNLSGRCIMLDEATIFLSNRGSNNLVKQLLVQKRHKKNVVLLVFHSFRQLPRYILDLANFIVVFKTNDSPELIESKYQNPDLLDVFNKVKRADWITNKKTGAHYSPHIFFACDGRIKA